MDDLERTPPLVTGNTTCTTTTSEAPPPPLRKSTLLSLPAEIRSQIWRAIFISPDPLTLSLSPSTSRTTSVLRVLTVCKLIAREATHIFYRHNTLGLSTPAALYRFLSSLHPLRRAEITTLAVGGFGLHYTGYQLATKAFSLLLLCPRLERFTLSLATDYPWEILTQAPNSSVVVDWEGFQEGLDCLGALRGLKQASIRGVDPAKWAEALKERYKGEDLEEVKCERAEELRLRWLRERVVRRTRAERALVEMESSNGGTGSGGKRKDGDGQQKLGKGKRRAVVMSSASQRREELDYYEEEYDKSDEGGGATATADFEEGCEDSVEIWSPHLQNRMGMSTRETSPLLVASMTKGERKLLEIFGEP